MKKEMEMTRLSFLSDIRLPKAHALLPFWFLFLSLGLLRLKSLQDLNLDLSSGLSNGLALGFFHDFVLVSFVFVLSVLIRIGFPFRTLTLFRVFGFLAWTACLSNVLYFGFFARGLDLWVLKSHTGDLLTVKNSVGNLAGAIPILFSLFFIVLALWFPRRGLFGKEAQEYSFFNWVDRQPRLRLTSVAIFAFIGALLLRQGPMWLGILEREPLFLTSNQNILSDLVVANWFEQLTGVQAAWQKRFQEQSKEMAGITPQAILQEFYSNQRTRIPSLPNKKPRKSDTAIPPELQSTQNIIVLYIESFRLFELFHPETSARALPRTRKILSEKSILFTNAYTSSFDPGMTVRGMFSTDCSFLPNVGGPSTFTTQPALRTPCIQDLFHTSGGEVTWIHSFPQKFHNMGLFERSHGTRTLFDQSYFLKKGIPPRPDGELGVEDGPFLLETKNILQNLYTLQKPFLATVLTVGTHHPFHKMKGFDFESDFEKKFETNPNYLGYLSQLKALDAALSQFLDWFLTSKLSENTLLVLLGDHSHGLRPHFNINEIQWIDLSFRIPIALVSPKIKNPRTIRKIVHQVDIAPTLARVLHLPLPSEWIGKGLFQEQGTPFVYQNGDRIHYRTDQVGCYTPFGERQPRCWELSDDEPLFGNFNRFREVSAVPEITLFFRQVLYSTSKLLMSGSTTWQSKL